MTKLDIANQLESIAGEEDFEAQSAGIVEAWTSAGLGIKAVEPILQFMEEHPVIDYGPPGPLVHFVEMFDSPFYKALVVESLRRKPTAHTAWMLNRLINGERDVEAKRYLVQVMEASRMHPLADDDARGQMNDFLGRLRKQFGLATPLPKQI